MPPRASRSKSLSFPRRKSCIRPKLHAKSPRASRPDRASSQHFGLANEQSVTQVQCVPVEIAFAPQGRRARGANGALDGRAGRRSKSAPLNTTEWNVGNRVIPLGETKVLISEK